MPRRTSAVSGGPSFRSRASAGLVLALTGAALLACTPFERASDCQALAEATRPLTKLGKLAPEEAAFGRAVEATRAVTATLTKLPKSHPTLKEPRKQLQKQLGELTRELESAQRALRDDSQRAYTAARARVMSRQKSLAQTLSTLTAACR